jgi:DNA polymerase-1
MAKQISDSKCIAIDTETSFTDSYAERFPVGISIYDGMFSYYIPVGHTEWVEKPINFTLPDDFLADYSGVVVMHNAKFDLHVLKRLGLEVPTGNLYDTMLMSHYIEEEPATFIPMPHSLDSLSARKLNLLKRTDMSKIMKKGDWSGTPIAIMAKYAEQDAFNTFHLYFHFKPEFEPYEKVWTLDRTFLLQLLEMEAKGLPISEDLCREYSVACRVREDQIKQELGFDPAKPSQLNPKLFGEPPLGLGLTPSEFTPSRGDPKVSSDWLELQAHPVCALVLEYRRLVKQRSTFFDRFLGLSAGRMRIHPTFKAHGTVTGRLSCEDPNMQQIPRTSYTSTPVKKVFIGEPNFQLWETDYSQLELRLAAVYSKQTNLLDDFHNDRDVHQRVADALGISRQIAKIVNFLLIYGGGPPALSKQAKIPLNKAKEVFNNYHNLYPLLFELMAAAERTAMTTGYVQLFSGRRRHFHHSSDCRKAFNSIIQGGGFEIVKRSMLLCREAGVDIRNQVHDSIWYMVPEDDVDSYVSKVESIMSDWTEPAFKLKFTVESKRLN